MINEGDPDMRLNLKGIYFCVTVAGLVCCILNLVFLSGQLLELVGEHPSNEHWWEVRNEEGNRGFVPSSYVLIKKDQVWKHQENFVTLLSRI